MRMTLIDAFLISTRCRTRDELKDTDKYVKRFLAGQLEKHGVIADCCPLESWNDALTLFGGTPADNAEEARIRLLQILSGTCTAPEPLQANKKAVV